MFSRIKCARWLPILPFLLVVAASARGETLAASLEDGRTGKIYFESWTPAGVGALARRDLGPKTVVFGTLRLPKQAAGRAPAMVIAHGSSGVDTREDEWADRLGKLGMATFVVDSFTPRNIRSTGTDQTQLSTAANVADALAALHL